MSVKGDDHQSARHYGQVVKCPMCRKVYHKPKLMQKHLRGHYIQKMPGGLVAR